MVATGGRLLTRRESHFYQLFSLALINPAEISLLRRIAVIWVAL